MDPHQRLLLGKAPVSKQLKTCGPDLIPSIFDAGPFTTQPHILLSRTIQGSRFTRCVYASVPSSAPKTLSPWRSCGTVRVHLRPAPCTSRPPQQGGDRSSTRWLSDQQVQWAPVAIQHRAVAAGLDVRRAKCRRALLWQRGSPRPTCAPEACWCPVGTRPGAHQATQTTRSSCMVGSVGRRLLVTSTCSGRTSDVSNAFWAQLPC